MITLCRNSANKRNDQNPKFCVEVSSNRFSKTVFDFIVSQISFLTTVAKFYSFIRALVKCAMCQFCHHYLLLR